MNQQRSEADIALWDRGAHNPIMEAIANFASGFDLDYEQIDRAINAPPDALWSFIWSGEIPGTWVKVLFLPLQPQSPKWLMINGILNDSRMPVVLEFELDELDDDIGQLETALEELQLFIGFG